jgi:hypothetical protein
VKYFPVLFVLLANLVISPAYCQTRKQLIAGAVEVTGNKVTGSFRVEEPGRNGIEASGTGGACLVFSKHSGGGATCRVDDECTLDAQFAGGAAYCLRPDGAKTGRCWMRPSETPDAPYCRRSPLVPLPTNQSIEFPVDGSGKLLPATNVRPGWWRVHACLNKQPGGCASSADLNKITSNGAPRKIP